MLTRQRHALATPRDPLEGILGDGPMLAPLCGLSDSAFRRVCRSFGAGLVFSEMISAEGLVRGGGGAWRMLRFHPGELPLAVQLSSASPRFMAEAAAIVADLGASSINLNMGCPARKVVKGDKGAGLMKDPDLAARVVEAVVAASPLPVTVKMRSGWDADRINALELGRRVRDAGAAALILHPRTRVQGYTGQADWSLIRALREAVDVPVVGNGDVVDGESAVRMVRETGCARVMVGRASVGRPWVFREVRAALAGLPIPAAPGPAEILGALERQLDWSLEELPETVAVRQMRRHILAAARGLPAAAAFRHHLVRQESAAGQRRACRSFFLEGLPGGGLDA